jgi:hypothetical protein
MCDLQVAMASAASASLQSRRGVYQALMDARESAFLAAHFQRQRSPSGDELARLARLCDLAPERVYKYFNNQRFTSRKRKAPAAACAAGDSPEDEQMATAVGPPHAQSEPNRTRAALRVAVDAILHGRNPTAAPELHAAPAAASAPPLQLQVTDAAVTRAAAAASAVSSAAGGAPIVAAPPLTDDELNAELSACLSVQLPSAAAAAAAVPATAAAAASAVDVAAAGVSKNRSAAPTAGRSSSSTRLERFHAWLQSRGVDPFACARRCDVLRLALLVEQYGRSSSTISFVFAGACVLQAALQQCNMPPPQSLADWQQLLAQTLDTARLCRQADSLWYHVRRGGAAFCESVPTKARDDTLTALAVVGAIAPHDKTMSELVRKHSLECVHCSSSSSSSYLVNHCAAVLVSVAVVVLSGASVSQQHRCAARCGASARPVAAVQLLLARADGRSAGAPPRAAHRSGRSARREAAQGAVRHLHARLVVVRPTGAAFRHGPRPLELRLGAAYAAAAARAQRVRHRGTVSRQCGPSPEGRRHPAGGAAGGARASCRWMAGIAAGTQPLAHAARRSTHRQACSRIGNVSSCHRTAFEAASYSYFCANCSFAVMREALKFDLMWSCASTRLVTPAAPLKAISV